MGIRHLFGDESGDLKSQPFFLVGLVITDDPGRCEAELRVLREQSKYMREVHWTSTDRLKLPLCISMLDWFFSKPYVHFSAICYERGVHSLAYYPTDHGLHPADQAYNVAYRRIVEKNIDNWSKSVLIMDDRHRRATDNVFKYLRREVPKLVDVQAVDSHCHMLIQLADLLTGAIDADLKGQVQNGVKLLIRDTLLTKLGVSSMRQWRRAKFKQRKKLDFWIWRPPRAVKLADGKDKKGPAAA